MPKAKDPIQEIRDNVSKWLETLDQESPISATVVFKVKKDSEDTFKKNGDELMAATRKLEGCIVFVVSKHQPYPGEAPNGDAIEYAIYEDWETVRHFRKQWESDHLKKFQFSVLELLAGPPDLTFYTGWSRTAGEALLPKPGKNTVMTSKAKPSRAREQGRTGITRQECHPLSHASLITTTER